MNILQRILQGVTNATTTPAGIPIGGPSVTTLGQASGQPGITMDSGLTPSGDPADALAAPAPTYSAQHPRLGVLDAIGHLLSPEPGSFVSSMWNNGLVNARAGQSAYRQAQEKEIRDAQAEETKTREQAANATKAEAAAKKERYITTPVGDVLDTENLDANGQPTVIFTAPEKTPEAITLLERYKAETDPVAKAALLQAIKGYNYSPSVMAASEAAKEALAEARARYTAKYRAPKGGGGKAATPNVPSGFHLVQ